MRALLFMGYLVVLEALECFCSVIFYFYEHVTGDAFNFCHRQNR